MLALALGTHAQVFILDEPLASLDPLARREFLHVLVDAVRADGATAVLSSHVITDIEQACNRIVVLGGGRKILDVPIGEAISTHRVSAASAEPFASEMTRVGTFPDPMGERVTLWQVPPDRADEPAFRVATLEEVILGQLAASRVPRVHAQSPAA
jgi:ABC-2 type transport system ATP-binding protein